MQLAFTAGLCALLAAMVDLGGVARELRRADPAAIGAALGFALLTYPPMALRWQMILRRDGIRAPFAPLLSIYVESGFFSLFLPSAIGGDVFRAARVHRLVGGVRRTAVGLLTERLIGIWAVCSLAIVSLAVARAAPGPILWIVALALALVAVASLLAISAAAGRFGQRVLARLRLSALAALHERVFAQFHGYMREPAWVARLVLLSIALQSLTVFSIYFASRAAGLELDVWFYMLVMPVVWLLSLVPALGGVGPREAGIVYFLVAAGIDREPATAVAVLVLGVTIARGLLGGALYLARSLAAAPNAH